MNNEYKRSLSPVEIFAILSRLMMGVSLAGQYREVTMKSSRDAWMVFPLAGLMITAVVWMILILGRRFPSYTFFEYSSRIVGKVLGKLINLAFCLYLTFCAGITLRFFGDMVNTWVLHQTPMWVILLCSMLPLLYLARKGLPTLAKFSTVITILIIPFLIFLLIPASKWNIGNLLPVGQVGLKGILSGIPPSFFAYFGYETLLILYPYCKDPKKAGTASVSAAIYVVTVYSLVIGMLMMYFGPKELQRVLFPVLVYLNAAEIPVIERVDLFVFLFDMFAIFSCVSIFYYMATLGLHQTFKKPERESIALWTFPIIALIAWYPQNFGVMRSFQGILSVLNMAIGVGIPAVFLLIAVIFKIKEEKKVEES